MRGLKNRISAAPPILFAVFLLLSIGLQLAFGDDLRVPAAVCFLVAILSWIALVSAARAGRFNGLAVIAVSAIVMTVCVAFPPATSRDVNSYAMYGRMVSAYDANPYVAVPRDFPGDAWYPRVSYFWNDSPSVYGPVFTTLSAGVMSVAGPTFTKARLGFQGLAAISLLACLLLLWLRGRDRNAPALAFVGLNPLLLTFGVNDAHADVLLGFLVLAAVISLDRRRLALAGMILGLAVLIKISALPAIAGAVIWATVRIGVVPALRVALASLITVAAGFLAAGGREVLDPLLAASSRHSRFSLWNPVHDALSFVASAATLDRPISLLAGMTVAAVGLTFIWRHRRDGSAAVPVTAGLVAYQVLGAYTLSWYAAWSIPALALAWRSRIAAIAMVHGSWIAVAYLNGYLALILAGAGALFVAWWRRRGQPLSEVSS